MQDTTPTTPTHADVIVTLTGADSNVFSLLGACTKALKTAGYHADADILAAQIMNSGSFDEALHHMTQMVVVK